MLEMNIKKESLMVNNSLGWGRCRDASYQPQRIYSEDIRNVEGSQTNGERKITEVSLTHRCYFQNNQSRCSESLNARPLFLPYFKDN